MLSSGCDAERDNPWDPNSPYGARITGWVRTKTGEPAEDVKVEVKTDVPQTKYCFSNDSGYYEIGGIPVGYCKVVASGESYAVDSVWVQTRLGREDTVNFFLDILPEFLWCEVTSEHFPGVNNFGAFFEAEIYDGDGPADIESVSLFIQGLETTFTLEYEEGVYRKMVYNRFLPDSSIELLIGKDCWFVVRDRAGCEMMSSPVRVSRIIYPTPEDVSPGPGDVVEAHQDLEIIWRQVVVPYPHTYAVGVTSDPYGVPLVYVAYKQGLPASDTSFSVNLSPGEYFWTVWAVDEFGNRSQSRTVKFKVQ